MSRAPEPPESLHDLSDEALLNRFIEGNAEALGLLASRYELGLLGMARGLLAGRDDLAREAVQDMWVRVIRFAPRFEGRCAVKTWLYRILINRCRTRARQAPRATPEPQPSRVEPAADHEESLVRVRRAVRSLPESARELILLATHEGLTQQQAAEVLDIPLGTLKTRLRAAIGELRAALSPEHAP